MSKINYYTESGLQKLKDELQDMERVQRPLMSAQIGEAIGKGDLSENAEYDSAKEAQGSLEMKIAKLKEIRSNARLIDESTLDTSKALILSTVKIKKLSNNADVTYTLVVAHDADLKAKLISVDSPIGN